MTAIIACIAILVIVAAIYLRERAAQKRLSAGAARRIAERLGASITQTGNEWRITGKLDGRPILLGLGGRFVVNSDTDNRSSFVPTADIEVPSASSVELAVHGNWPGGKNYLRNMAARVRGSKLLTGAADFDSQFLVEGSSPSDAATVDDNIQKKLLASKAALYGRSWALQIAGGTVRFEEVFNEDMHGGDDLTETQVVDDVLDRLSLVLALAASAEQRKPSIPTKPSAGTPVPPGER